MYKLYYFYISQLQILLYYFWHMFVSLLPILLKLLPISTSCFLLLATRHCNERRKKDLAHPLSICDRFLLVNKYASETNKPDTVAVARSRKKTLALGERYIRWNHSRYSQTRLISSGTKKGSPWNFRNIRSGPELSKGKDSSVRRLLSIRLQNPRQKLPCISPRERYTLYADGYRLVLALYSRRTELSGNFYPAWLPGRREKEEEEVGRGREMELFRCLNDVLNVKKREGTRKSYIRSRGWLSRVSSLDSLALIPASIRTDVREPRQERTRYIQRE